VLGDFLSFRDYRDDMIRGFAKAFVVIMILVTADQSLADGMFTEAAWSMLHEMANSFR
jgi:hypothetical protein